MDKIKKHLKKGRDLILTYKASATTSLRQRIALLYVHLTWGQNRLVLWQARHSKQALILLICLLIGVSIYITPILQGKLEPYFSSSDKLSDLRSLLHALGGALIGAAAIVSSLVMFAIQVNVERMPHGLFRKLSSDARIMGAFGSTFAIAIAVAGISLFPDASWVAAAILSSVWGIVLILLLFLYAYRRALLLINPIQQLNIVVKGTDSSLNTWAKRAKRATPLFESARQPEGSKRPVSSHDVTRVAFFKAHPYWVSVAEQAVRYAMSFAIRYAKQGDHEVSWAALSSVIRINQCYVKAKGRTFFTDSGLIENPLTTDGFINNTLEHLRQALKSAISNGDEQFIEQSFIAMEQLLEVYVSIDYCTPFGSKTHAFIAAGYLSEAVKSVIPYDMADVLMEGTRLMGRAAQILLSHDKPTSIKTSVDNIVSLACLGAVKESYRPVTLIAMEQLSSLTFNLIRTPGHDIRFIAKDIRESVTMVAKLFLNVPEASLDRIHCTYLGPYYSGTNAQAFLHLLGELINVVSEKPADDENAKTVIRNIENWADGLYSNEKELLLLSINKRSSFTFDIINWIKSTAVILMALSNTEACDARDKERLRKHALSVLCTFSWIPKDRETVAYVEVYHITEILFEAAIEAHMRDCLDIFIRMQGYLLDWGFKAGRHHLGWALLERSIYGLATLTLTTDSCTPEQLKTQITNILGQQDMPDQEMKDSAAREIRHTAESLYRDGHWSSRIDYQMRQVDNATMQALLKELADLISPNTADEPVSTRVF